MEYDDQFLYLFIHVPKCLGTTLTDAIGQHIPKSVHVYRADPGLTREQIVSETSQEMRSRSISPDQLRVIHGHGVFEGLHVVSPRPPRYFTFVREAARRHLSLYNYFRVIAAAGDHPLSNEYRGYVFQAAKLLEYPDWLETRNDFWNLMTRTLYFATIDKFHEPLRPFPDTADFDHSHVSAVGRFLERMFLVGVVEYSHEDLRYVSSLLNMPSELPRLNSSASFFNLESNPSVAKRSTYLNWMDTAVYQNALSLRAKLQPPLRRSA